MWPSEYDVHGGCGDVLNDEFVNVAYFGFVNVVICAVDENDFVVFEDDGNEVVIVDRYEVDDNDDEMLGENMMNAIGEVMVDGVDVMRGEYCDAGYFGCVDVIDCSVVDVGVMVCVDCEYEEVDGDVIDENRVDVAEAVEVDSNDLVVSELLSTNDMHDFDVVSFVIVDRYDVDDNDDEMLGENMMNAIGEVMVDGVDVMRGEYCDAGYFGCVDVIDCSVVDVGVMVCVDCEYEEVDGDVIDENRVDVAEAVEVDSNDLVVSELLSTNDMHDFDVVSYHNDVIDEVVDVHGGCGDVLNDEFVNVAYFGFVNVVICAVDENDFVVFEDDGNEVVIVDRYEVDDNDDEMLGENMMNAIGEVMVDGVDVMRGEYCDAGYFGCVDVIDCSVVDVGVMVCVDCEYEEVDGDVIDENRVDVAEAVEVDSNDLVVSELLSTNDMHDFDVVSCNRDYFVALESVGEGVATVVFPDDDDDDVEDEMVINDVICENMLHDFGDIVINGVNVNDNVVIKDVIDTRCSLLLLLLLLLLLFLFSLFLLKLWYNFNTDNNNGNSDCRFNQYFLNGWYNIDTSNMIKML
ncbi:hypothetical protein KSF78_0009565 [Schistosoma japonicum]|nr:hypothetical protein KSF78_0009565 [Schistosoma japonicum]